MKFFAMLFGWLCLLPTLAFAQAPDHPMTPYTIESLRQREYAGGLIQVRELLASNAQFTRYLIAYPSDGLTVTGVLQIPSGEGPFPVIILNHGYWSRATYRPGTDTAEAAGYFNEHGYLTIAPDYRSWGESDTGSSFFHTGLVIDVINLISALESLPVADTERIGIWGHSMGGGITTKVLTIDERVKAAVLYAPNSADDADLIAMWGPGCDPQQPTRIALLCNEAEVIPSDLPEAIFEGYAHAVNDPMMMQAIAPLYHFEYITAPVQIHIGTADDVTPPEWSAKMVDELQLLEKKVEIYHYAGQGHFLSGQHWFTFMERSVVFFDRVLASG